MLLNLCQSVTDSTSKQEIFFVVTDPSEPCKDSPIPKRATNPNQITYSTSTYVKRKLSRVIVESAAVHQGQDVLDRIRRENPFIRQRTDSSVGQSGGDHGVALTGHLHGTDLVEQGHSRLGL